MDSVQLGKVLFSQMDRDNDRLISQDDFLHVAVVDANLYDIITKSLDRSQGRQHPQLRRGMSGLSHTTSRGSESLQDFSAAASVSHFPPPTQLVDSARIPNTVQEMHAEPARSGSGRGFDDYLHKEPPQWRSPLVCPLKYPPPLLPCTSHALGMEVDKSYWDNIFPRAALCAITICTHACSTSLFSVACLPKTASDGVFNIRSPVTSTAGL